MQFCRRHHEEQFREIILNLDEWFRRYFLKIVFMRRSGGPVAQHSGTVCAILVEGIKRKNSVNYLNLDQ